MVEALKIVAFSIFSAVIYGVMHDFVTAHLSLEYFTVAHPQIFATKSPLWLAIGWGVIATWWVGLILGICLAAAARVGSRRKAGFAEVKPAIVRLMLVSAVSALAFGSVGAFLTSLGWIYPSPAFAKAIPQTKWIAFLAVGWAHAGSYLAGGLGGVFVVTRTLQLRRKEQ